MAESGTVSAGKHADLILLHDNPLDDVASVRNRLGVMVRGHWLPETELRAMLAQVVDSYSPSLLDRAWPLIPVALGLLLLLRPWIIGKKKQVIQPS